MKRMWVATDGSTEGMRAVAFAARVAAGRRFVDLPSGCVPAAPLIVGHPDSVAPPVPRKAPVIQWMD